LDHTIQICFCPKNTEVKLINGKQSERE